MELNTIENISHSAQRMPHDDLADDDDQQAILSILTRMSRDEVSLIRGHFCQEQIDEMQMFQHRVLGLITKVVSFACFPFNPSKLWGMIYALDLPFHEGRSPSDIAKTLGKTRANISGYMTDFCAITSMAPSRWMRSEGTAKKCKESREGNLQ